MQNTLEAQSRFDHLVIGASALDVGISWFEKQSGIQLPMGGEHPLMGTHNHLSAITDNTFLEVIAINPDAEPPTRPRWFGLDDESVQQRLAKSPTLLTWVVACSDLRAALERLQELGIDAGESVTQRRGNLTWQIAVRPDGGLLENGCFPVLIEWPKGVNPVISMTRQGLDIERLVLVHPEPDLLLAGLEVINYSSNVEVLPEKGASRHMAATLRAGTRIFSIV
ncbi:MAG: VOC family protein [Granulosicoccus sp.]